MPAMMAHPSDVGEAARGTLRGRALVDRRRYSATPSAARIVTVLQALAMVGIRNYCCNAAAAGAARMLLGKDTTVPHISLDLESSGATIEFELPEEHPTSATETPLFSQEWATQYSTGQDGCDLARGSYMWRKHGMGSNINNLLNAWVYALSVEKWSDMTVVIDEHQMKRVKCGEESREEAEAGWECLFSPMPHLCTFPTAEAWEEHMVSRKVSAADLAEAARLDQDAVRFHPEEIIASLESSGVDHTGALAAMAKYLWSYMTPWLQADIDFVVRAPATDVFEESPFLGLHVRRGDKVEQGEAHKYLCEEYLAAAVVFLEGPESPLNVGDIKGIWVASDDPEVVTQVKQLAPSYLPNVTENNIVWASGGVEGGPKVGRTPTHTSTEDYGDFVYTFADLQQLTAADVFVGTFSSNMGRLLVLLRESIGGKERATAISIDSTWRAGRQRRFLVEG